MKSNISPYSGCIYNSFSTLSNQQLAQEINDDFEQTESVDGIIWRLNFPFLDE
ncbi:MAG: hypothetical protein R8G66_10775 [Cytophagales bacterium]|nr:hypothetical protein [Cytophagales bacterium]